MEDKEARKLILDEMVQACPFVDKCEKKCIPSDHEECYGIAAGNVLITIKETGYRKVPSGYHDVTEFYKNKPEVSGEPPVRKARHDWRWNSPSSGYRQCRRCGEIRTICGHCKVGPCKGNQDGKDTTP